MRRARIALISIAVPAIMLATLAPADAARPGFVFPGVCCFYNGQLVRTVTPPAAFPNTGIDPFYAITNGVSGQKGVVAVAPGAVGYHGGHWAFNAVSFNPGVTPYLLTSADAVLAAAAAGDVSISRDPAMDFICPIQLCRAEERKGGSPGPPFRSSARQSWMGQMKSMVGSRLMLTSPAAAAASTASADVSRYGVTPGLKDTALNAQWPPWYPTAPGATATPPF